MCLRIRRLLSVLLICIQLSLLSAGVLTQTSCGEVERSQAIEYAEEAVATAKEILPVFTSAGLSSSHINRGVQIGSDLVTAFRENRDADALSLTAAFIDVVDRDILSDVNTIKDQGKRTLALAITAAIRISLRRIAKFLKPAEDASMLRGARVGTSSRAKVREFAKSKDWRCRNSITGRFEKMSFCKTNPANSVVETF